MVIDPGSLASSTTTEAQPTAQDLIHYRAQLVLNEIQSARDLYSRMGEPFPDLIDLPWAVILRKLYTEEFPLAKVLDESKLIVYADGPGLVFENPRLDIVTWLCNGIQTQTRALTASALNLGPRSRLVQSIRFRITGLASGSLYAGFSIDDDGPITTVTESALAEEVDVQEPQAAVNVISTARDAIINLTKVPAHVEENEVSESLGEEILDPAQRDASLMAAPKLAPTGRNGVSSVKFDSRFSGRTRSEGTFTTSDRVVIQDTLSNRPLIAKGKKRGSFVGQLRALDLDKTRVDLRNVAGVGNLRCIVHLDVINARNVIGRWVRVTGEYEANASGRPRLLVAENIELSAEPPLSDQLRR